MTRPARHKEHHFRARLSWTGAAQGATASYAGYSREHVVAIAGKPPLRGSADPAFRGDPALHNPEDLLVAALASCHMLSFLAEAARAGVVVTAYEDAAEGTMAARDDGVIAFREVVLRPVATVAAGTDPDEVAALHDKAHHGCFIASSVNFPVRHEARLEIAAAAA